MEKNDLDLILQAINQNKKAETLDRNKILDWVFKALVAVVVWVAINTKEEQTRNSARLDKVEAKISTMETQDLYKAEAMEDIKAFISKPRFTEEDYEQKTDPLKRRVERAEDELKSRSDFMRDHENRLLKVEIFVKRQKENER